MSCFDSCLAPIPRRNRAAHEESTRVSARVLQQHGATRVVVSLGERPRASNR